MARKEDRKIRIQKYLSQEGILSRRKAEAYLEKGWIKVNGKVVTTQGVKIDPEFDRVELSEEVEKIRSSYTYLKYYKPRGIVTNLPQDDEEEIKDYLPKKYRHLSAIGRLDKESEGLILLSDDGIFSKRLLDTAKPHSRTYIVKVSQTLTPGMRDKLRHGMRLMNEKTKPLKLRCVGHATYELIMIEGKNRQIRRMMQKLGVGVVSLKRIRFGHIGLDIRPGEFRELSEHEVMIFS